MSEVVGLAEVVSAWVQGWAISRGTSAPERTTAGHRIEVGLPGHKVRYVLPQFDPVQFRELVSELTEPGTWVKVCASPEEVAAVLPGAWTITDPEFLMTAPVRRAELTVPEPYTLRVITRDAVAEVQILADGEQVTTGTEPRALANGELVAAEGQVALTGSYGIFDKVVTDLSHRRRGLGSLVMTALGDYAAVQDAHTGVLVATEDGRELYRAQGWTLRSPVTAVVLRRFESWQ